ncbi:porin [Ferrimonas pelagia]|uniref:Porin n=1 Tax=Ferrimonas pelagia TaxID=1177826 RepID=A0ABP9F019_9GAMM
MNLGYERKLNNGYTAELLVEQALNTRHSGNAWTTRHASVALDHEQYGNLAIGKQWGVFYDVISVTDMPNVFPSDQLGLMSNDFLGELSGTGSAENALFYRNNLNLGDAGQLNFGVQWQGATSGNSWAGDYDLDNRFAVAFQYEFAGIVLGVAHTSGSFDQYFGVDTEQFGDKLESTAFAASYGSYGEGLYLATAYAMGKNLEAGHSYRNIAGDTTGFEVLGAYAWDNGWMALASYRQLDNDGEILRLDDQTGSTSWNEQFFTAGVEKSLSENVALFGEYNHAMGDDMTDNQWAVGVRFFL